MTARIGCRLVVAVLLPLCVLSGCGRPTGWSSDHAQVAYSGPHTITRAGTVIKGEEITRPLVIAADHVTIQRNLIHTATNPAVDEPIIQVAKGTTGTRILDNEIRGDGDDLSREAMSGVKLYGNDTEFSGNDVSQIAGDALTIDGTALKIIDNYIHDFVYRAGVHYDGIVYGGSNTTNSVLIQNNRVEMWLKEGMTAVVSLPDEATHMVVDGNLLAGGSYTLMGGGGGVRFSNNRFSTKYAATGGLYGTHAHLADAFSGVTWINNVWADGAFVGKSIDY